MTDHPFQDFAHAEQAKSNKVRQLYAYWIRLQRHGKPGSRTDFDPTEVPSLLSSLLLGDIERDPFRVFFRLVGTRVAAFSRLDFSGFYLDALDYRGRDSIEWEDCYRRIQTTGNGVVGVNRVSWPDTGRVEYEFAILPLERNGDPTGSFVAIENYDGIDPHLIPDLPIVRSFPTG
ncbi:MAG TPA: PAS domain-containing protein [Candidatus Binatia bacterium]|nr:PAS domain-containing protein [Candidatus Binatia bacterium]